MTIQDDTLAATALAFSREDDSVKGSPLPGPALAADGTLRRPGVGYDHDGYPCEEALPVSQNIDHVLELVRMVSMLDEWLARRHPGALIAADANLYWDEGNVKRRVVPDVLIALGAGRRERQTYKLWVEGAAPDVIFEVLSASTWREDVERKRDLFEWLGVREYWLVDPARHRFPTGLEGHRLRRGRYEWIRRRPGTDRLPSEVLALDFRLEDGRLAIRDRESGEDLKPLREEKAARMTAEHRAEEERASRVAERTGRSAAERQRDEERTARRSAEGEVERLRRELERRQ